MKTWTLFFLLLSSLSFATEAKPLPSVIENLSKKSEPMTKDEIISFVEEKIETENMPSFLLEEFSADYFQSVMRDFMPKLLVDVNHLIENIQEIAARYPDHGLANQTLELIEQTSWIFNQEEIDLLLLITMGYHDYQDPLDRDQALKAVDEYYRFYDVLFFYDLDEELENNYELAKEVYIYFWEKKNAKLKEMCAHSSDEKLQSYAAKIDDYSFQNPKGLFVTNLQTPEKIPFLDFSEYDESDPFIQELTTYYMDYLTKWLEEFDEFCDEHQGLLPTE